MAILTIKSKVFIKAKLAVSKRFLIESACFMICSILGDTCLQNLSFLRGPSTEFIFFNLSDIATYPRKLGNWNWNLLIFSTLLSENNHSDRCWPSVAALSYNGPSGSQQAAQLWLSKYWEDANNGQDARPSSDWIDFHIIRWTDTVCLPYLQRSHLHILICHSMTHPRRDKVVSTR